MLHSGLATVQETEWVGMIITPKEPATWWEEIKVLWKFIEEISDSGASVLC